VPLNVVTRDEGGGYTDGDRGRDQRARLHREHRRIAVEAQMIGHVIFGLFIGVLARAVMPGRQHMGLILTMILGLVGAWLGGLIDRLIGNYKEEGHPAGWFTAPVGALIVLFVYSRVVACFLDRDLAQADGRKGLLSDINVERRPRPRDRPLASRSIAKLACLIRSSSSRSSAIIFAMSMTPASAFLACSPL